MKTKEWVSVHRKHHARCETADDPHSPVIEGVSQILWRGAEYYRKAKKDPGTLEQFGIGTPDDWLERNVYSTPFLRGKQGILLLLLIEVILLGVPGIIVWGIQMAWTPFFAAGVINGIGHFVGYRNYECADASTNLMPWGILIVGEELHNNHHTYGTSAKLSSKWWELDLGWQYIKILRFVGLANVKRLPPKMLPNRLDREVDIEAVTTLVADRLRILARFSRQVIRPVFQEERGIHRENLTLREAFTRRRRALLVRNSTLLSAPEVDKISVTLSQSETLRQVCQSRDDLNAICAQTMASQGDLIDALKTWCHNAEQSGIHALENFARFLKSYRVKV